MIRKTLAQLHRNILVARDQRKAADPNGFRMDFSRDRKALGDYWFRRFLEALEPRLSDDGVSELEKAHLIRRLIFEHVVRARFDPILQLGEKEGFKVFERSASELFMALDAKIGGILCSGSAYALMKTYALFGLGAFVYNFGLPGTGFTHAVSVVTVNHKGRNLAVIEDAHFNLTITRADGSPVDFFDALELLRDRRHDALKRDMDRERKNFRIDWKSDPRKANLLKNGVSGKDYIDLGDGRIVIPSFNDQDKWARHIDMPTLLEPLGYPADILYLFCLPINAQTEKEGHGEEADGILNEIQRILEQGVPDGGN